MTMSAPRISAPSTGTGAVRIHRPAFVRRAGSARITPGRRTKRDHGRKQAVRIVHGRHPRLCPSWRSRACASLQSLTGVKRQDILCAGGCQSEPGSVQRPKSVKLVSAQFFPFHRAMPPATIKPEQSAPPLVCDGKGRMVIPASANARANSDGAMPRARPRRARATNPDARRSCERVSPSTRRRHKRGRPD